MKFEMHFFLALFIAELKTALVTQEKELVWLLTYTNPLHVYFKFILPNSCFMRDDQCPTELSVMEMDGYWTLKMWYWETEIFVLFK